MNNVKFLNQNILPNLVNLEKKPKFLYRVDFKMPEEVFQYGFSIENDEFDFFDYFFNRTKIDKNTKKSYINAYESISDALINFRKDLVFVNNQITDLYLYLIRVDEHFYNKEITRYSIPTAICDKRISTNIEDAEKLMYLFLDVGQRYNNPNEWFTIKEISNDQIYGASQIKLDISTIYKKNEKHFLITPSIINLFFRNPNYSDLNTTANKRPFIYPETNGIKNLSYKNKGYYFCNPIVNYISNKKEPFLKSFVNNNPNFEEFNKIFFERKWIDKKTINSKNILLSKKKEKIDIITSFVVENFDYLIEDIKNNFLLKVSNTFFKPKKIKLLLTYFNNPNKSVYLNVNDVKKKSIIFFEHKRKENKNIASLVFDKYGRFILANNNSKGLRFALTITNYDKMLDLAEIESYPAVVNQINQYFVLEHAHTGIFFIKPNDQELRHLELAIKHKNNTFVFINPKKKYNFSYDVVVLDINKYKKNEKGFIYGNDCYCPEMINLKFEWYWNKYYFKPNIYVTWLNESVNIEQARSSVSKTTHYNFLYNINTMKILAIDYNKKFSSETLTYSLTNNINENEKYNWIKWEKDNIFDLPPKSKKWFLKIANYNDESFYWIKNVEKNDRLWIQQKGENWGFLFSCNENLIPQKSSSLFMINKNNIK